MSDTTILSDEELTEEDLAAKYSEPISEEEESEHSEEQSIDTETDTSADEAIDTDTETSENSTEEEVDPVKTAFQDSGLDKTYADPAAAFKAHSETQTELGRLRRELSEVRGQVPTPTPDVPKSPDFDNDAWMDRFQTDPQGALLEFNRIHGSGEIQRLEKEVQILQASNQLNAAISEFPDIREKESAILAEIEADPMLSQLYAVNPAWTVKQARKNLLASNPVAVEKTVETIPVSEETKERATTTTSGHPSRRNTSKKKDNWNSMSESEMEKTLGFGEE